MMGVLGVIGFTFKNKNAINLATLLELGGYVLQGWPLYVSEVYGFLA